MKTNTIIDGRTLILNYLKSNNATVFHPMAVFKLDEFIENELDISISTDCHVLLKEEGLIELIPPSPLKNYELVFITHKGSYELELANNRSFENDLKTIIKERLKDDNKFWNKGFIKGILSAILGALIATILTVLTRESQQQLPLQNEHSQHRHGHICSCHR